MPVDGRSHYSQETEVFARALRGRIRLLGRITELGTAYRPPDPEAGDGG